MIVEFVASERFRAGFRSASVALAIPYQTFIKSVPEAAMSRLERRAEPGSQRASRSR